MSLKTDTIVLGEYTYTVTQLPAMKGLKVFTRLGGKAGPALKAVAEALKGRKAGEAMSLGNMNVGPLAEALGAVLGALSEEEVEALCRDLFYNTTVTVDDKTKLLMPMFDIHLAGKFLEIFTLLKFAIEVNFGDFFNALRQLIANSSKALPSPA